MHQLSPPAGASSGQSGGEVWGSAEPFTTSAVPRFSGNLILDLEELLNHHCPMPGESYERFYLTLQNQS